MSKFFASEMADRSPPMPSRIHGAMAMSPISRSKRIYRDVPLLPDFEGTSISIGFVIARESHATGGLGLPHLG